MKFYLDVMACLFIPVVFVYKMKGKQGDRIAVKLRQFIVQEIDPYFNININIKINIFKIIDTRISFYSRNTHLLPPKPKSSFRHLKRGIQDFHMNYVLVPADKAANNVVVV